MTTSCRECHRNFEPRPWQIKLRNPKCPPCMTEYQRRWRLENPEKVREEARGRRFKNTERRRDTARRWRLKNLERLRELRRRWDLKNPEKVREARRRWDLKNPGKTREATRRWILKNPEKRKTITRRVEYKRTYGITTAQYEQMFKAQNGACAICDKLWVGGRRLAIDHDHKTGKVRALLCFRCNTLLGYYEKNIEKIPKLAFYLVKYKAPQPKEA